MKEIRDETEEFPSESEGTEVVSGHVTTECSTNSVTGVGLEVWI